MVLQNSDGLRTKAPPLRALALPTHLAKSLAQDITALVVPTFSVASVLSDKICFTSITRATTVSVAEHIRCPTTRSAVEVTSMESSPLIVFVMVMVGSSIAIARRRQTYRIQSHAPEFLHESGTAHIERSHRALNTDNVVQSTSA